MCVLYTCEIQQLIVSTPTQSDDRLPVSSRSTELSCAHQYLVGLVLLCVKTLTVIDVFQF